MSGKILVNGKVCYLFNKSSCRTGGEKQLGVQIENNELDLVIFLRDPLTQKVHEPDVNNVFRLCDIHNIPLATNVATAELLVKALERGDLDWRNLVRM